MRTDATAQALPDVLSELVASSRQRVTERERATSRDSLAARAVPSTRSLAAALRRPRASFILELKRRSPSRGDLRRHADVAEVLMAFRGVADAISVLTEPTRFGGALDDLDRARSLTDLPLLCKDFVVSPYQVLEARVHGADAVLLMMSVLDDAVAADCLRICHELSMDALVEVHDEIELSRALALGAEIIGINNRNFHDLSVDLSITERLAPLVPADRIVVSESGIRQRADVARLAPHVDAFLVGSALMTAADLRAAACALVGARVKICGLTRIEDADAATNAGAAFLGAVFVEGSPRNCDPVVARAMQECTSLPLVAVFRDQPMSEVIACSSRSGASVVQLHGLYDVPDLVAIRSTLPGIAIWRVVGVRPGAPPPSRPTLDGADRVLLDTLVDGATGGRQRFDHEYLRHLDALPEIVVAGGLRVADAKALAVFGPYALDVSSGVEVAPGVKDPALTATFIRATRVGCRGGTAAMT